MQAEIGDSGETRPANLWGQSDFLKLWGGQTVSLFGDQVSALALPLVAILLLQAGAMDMGLLAVARGAPLLILGLLAGAWTDRLPRRPILIAADLGRASCLASIPLAAVLGILSMSWLYVVAIVIGVFSVFFNVAYQSFLPTIVQRGDLVEANARLTVTRSLAGIAGPGLGGATVQLLTAPVAIVLDATSFAVSALCIGLIRHPETTPGPPVQPQKQQNVVRNIGDGLHFVRTQPLLRASAGTAGTYNLFNTALQTLYVLFLTRHLGIAPHHVGNAPRASRSRHASRGVDRR